MSVSSHARVFNSKPRNGEFVTRLPERSKRFFVEDGFWFFRTREREAVGPYANQDNARKAASTFGRFCRSVHDDQVRVLLHQHLEKLNHMSDQQRELPLRDGEMEIPSDRNERVLSKDGDWFFQTREGALVGPYDDKKVAEDSAITFTQFAQHVSGSQIHLLIATMNGEDVEDAVG